jgi:hypothetical protein
MTSTTLPNAWKVIKKAMAAIKNLSASFPVTLTIPTISPRTASTKIAQSAPPPRRARIIDRIRPIINTHAPNLELFFAINSPPYYLVLKEKPLKPFKEQKTSSHI